MFRTLVEMMVLSGVYSNGVFFVAIFEVELNLMFSYLYINVLFPSSSFCCLCLLLPSLVYYCHL